MVLSGPLRCSILVVFLFPPGARTDVCLEDAPLLQRAELAVPELGPTLDDLPFDGLPFQAGEPDKVKFNAAQTDVTLDHNNFDLEQLVEMTLPAEPSPIANEPGPQLLETVSVRAAVSSTAPKFASRWSGLPGSPLLLALSTRRRRDASTSVATVAASFLLGLVLVASISVCWFMSTAQGQQSTKKLQYTQASAGTNSSLPPSRRRVDHRSQGSAHALPQQSSHSLRQLPPKAQASADAASLTGAGTLAQVVAKMACLDVRCKVPPGHICVLSVPSLRSARLDQMLNITNFAGTTLLWTSLSRESQGSDMVQIYDLDRQLLASCSVDPSTAHGKALLILDRQGSPYATVAREDAGAQAQAVLRVRPQRATHTKWDLAVHMEESQGHSHVYLRGQVIAQFVSSQSGGYEGHFAAGGDCALLLLCFLVGELLAARGPSTARGL